MQAGLLACCNKAATRPCQALQPGPSQDGGPPAPKAGRTAQQAARPAETPAQLWPHDNWLHPLRCCSGPAGSRPCGCAPAAMRPWRQRHSWATPASAQAATSAWKSGEPAEKNWAPWSKLRGWPAGRGSVRRRGLDQGRCPCTARTPCTGPHPWCSASWVQPPPFFPHSSWWEDTLHTRSRWWMVG